MKKLFVLLTFALLLIFTLTACDNPSNLSDETTEESTTEEVKTEESTTEHTHTEVADAALAPTCTEAGLTEGSHCLICNEILVAQQTVAVLGHDHSQGTTCSRCGISYTIGLEFTLIKNGAAYEVSGGTTDTHIIIPNVYQGLPVTSIGFYAFEDCTSLTSITIPNSVTSIGECAFKGCTKLIQTENGVSYVDKWVIACDTTVTSVPIRSNTIGISNHAFDGCNLTSIAIPNSVTSIGSGAFRGCNSLESMTLPFVGDSIKTASDTYQYPFGYIFGTSYNVGSVETKQYYFGSSTSSATDNTYYIPSSLKSVTITGGNILFGAFYGCNNLTSITIPNGITSIGVNAFRRCSSLTSITIPDGVTGIGGRAFYNCNSLTSITIPDSVTSIGDAAFFNCSSLTSITIPDGVTSIDSSAFEDCSSLTSITIPNSVTSIGDYAFFNCSSLTSLIFEDTSTWYYTTSSTDWENKTGGTMVSVTDASTNVADFTSLTYSYYWYKK